ncbi:heme-binding domain-containing protein [Arenibacter sp. S6351L]|uniref:heme-binding domain-containing protein n=1 Tax=Arenibacter sp. S6351L TaxID=2926407 RepID=UPI001FF1B06C|nr:heme-binding domain-containing protein [Arenibacter sp. S6351L]MCK0136430.1 heme-binding domain-containing protein [Arenibacter sp. S6351L]
MLKKILLGLGVVLILIQFFRPEKNESNDNTNSLSTKYKVPEDVNHLLKVSCNDCHSNKTEYPWYSNVQPVAWFLNDHVVDGKKHLNFSNFTKLPLAIQYHKFEEIVEMVEEKEMPIPSYTYFGLHPEANLTQEQQDQILDWSKAQMAYLKATYPADSLVRKKRPGKSPSK